MFGSRAATSLVLAAVLVLAASCWNYPQETGTIVTAEPEARVSAAKLFDDYRADPARADLIYKDRVVLVSGVVDGIGADLAGTRTITLRAGKWEGERGVTCALYEGLRPYNAPEIHLGDAVSLKGRVLGSSGDVALGACVPAEKLDRLARCDTYRPGAQPKLARP
jgi:hypothetical protein